MTTATEAASGLLGRYLHDPSGTILRLLHRLGEWVHAWGPLLAVAVAALVGAAVAGARELRRRRRAGMATDARLITILAPPTVELDAGRALWDNLVGLLRPSWRRLLTGQPHLAWEYQFSEHGVEIRLWVPGVIPPGLVERAVEAAWPGAHTRVADATSPLATPPVGHRRLIVGGELRLARTEALPIRTNFDSDPLRALFAAPAGLAGDETACLQILARPVTGRRVARARTAARRLHTGGAGGLAGLLLDCVRLLLDLITPGPLSSPSRYGTAARTPQVDPQTTLEHSAQNRAMVTKQLASQYETVLRYTVVVLLPTDAPRAEAAAARRRARGLTDALAASTACWSEHNYYLHRRRRHLDTLFAQRRLGRGDLLSVPELGALAHLPVDDAIPGLARAGARAVAAPPGIATPGPDAKPLGVTDTGHPRPVALKVADARQHIHVLGATGSGKSTLLANMILADAEAGRGIVVIDPKGDLVSDLLSRLPATAADRVVLFDADSRSRPPCLNPLDGENTDLVVDNLTSVFRRVYAQFWGPRTDDIMRSACLTLRLQDGVTTLADIPRLLTDDAYRSRITAAVTDPVLASFWSEYEQLSDSSRAQIVAPLLNKLRAFLYRPFVRDALTAGRSTLDLGDILDGGICLVRIPKGSLGEESTRLIGSLVVAHTWQATIARARTPQSQRRDASLVIDECHNFLNLPYPIEDMLAEARGFRLGMTLSHQHLGQLTRELREGISANARSKIYFTSSPEDARELARHTAPRVSEHDLAHLGVYHAATRLVLDGQQTQPFTMTTQPLTPAIPGRAREIRQAARRPGAASTEARRPQPRESAQHRDTTPAAGSRPTDPRRR